MSDHYGRMAAILAEIKASPRIMIFRHIRPDGDCLGASKGLKRMLQLTYPEKEILLIDGAESEYLAFLGSDDAPVPEESYRDALGIVVDTGSADRISNPRYALCRKLIKIDHHIDRDAYAPLSWVEEERSSACEMIAAFYAAFREEMKIDSQAAALLYLGMVTDSGRFRFPGVTGDTLRLAGMLLDAGVDTQRLFAQLYLRDFDSFRFEAYIYSHIRRTENGVAYVTVDRACQREFGLSLEAASACVSYLDSIKGCLCWLAFIENEDGSFRVRLRSRFMAINGVAEAFGGGGHACASGATARDQAEINALIAVADVATAQYKAAHDDWL